MPAIAAALATGMAIAAPAVAQRVAESIWSGGPVLTMNDKAMRAEAVAVANGKILAVGKRLDRQRSQRPGHADGELLRGKRHG